MIQTSTTHTTTLYTDLSVIYGGKGYTMSYRINFYFGDTSLGIADATLDGEYVTLESAKEVLSAQIEQDVYHCRESHYTIVDDTWKVVYSVDSNNWHLFTPENIRREISYLRKENLHLDNPMIRLHIYDLETILEDALSPDDDADLANLECDDLWDDADLANLECDDLCDDDNPTTHANTVHKTHYIFTPPTFAQITTIIQHLEADDKIRILTDDIYTIYTHDIIYGETGEVLACSDIYGLWEINV